jgi:hypothetical protein
MELTMSEVKIVAMDSGIARIKVSDLEAGLYETSPVPTGNQRICWIMKLRREPGKSKLPRGFGLLSGKCI